MAITSCLQFIVHGWGGSVDVCSNWTVEILYDGILCISCRVFTPQKLANANTEAFPSPILLSTPGDLKAGVTSVGTTAGLRH